MNVKKKNLRTKFRSFLFAHNITILQSEVITVKSKIISYKKNDIIYFHYLHVQKIPLCFWKQYYIYQEQDSIFSFLHS